MAAPASVGGLERVVQGLAIGHHRMGHRVRVAAVVTPQVQRHPFLEPLLEAGVPVEVIRLPAKAYLRERRAVSELLRKERPDVVHTHGYRPDLLHADIVRRAGIPLVSTVHGSSRMGGATHFYEWLEERMWRTFDAVVAVSNPLAESLHASGISSDRLHVVPNAWTPVQPFHDRSVARERLGYHPGEFVFGWVGRLIEAKGCDIFLDALARLKDLPWRAAIIGDGPEREKLELLALEAGIGDRVTFHGMVNPAGPLYTAFDVYALTSRTEGTPIVLFEAMAARVPIVATTVGGVPDVISASEGTLVPPRDASSLAGALRMLRTEPGQAAPRVDSAWDRLHEDFGADRWLAQHESIYRQISARARLREANRRRG